MKMKKIGFQIMKDGSINGKLVALGLTALMVLIFIAGFWIEKIEDGIVAYGNRIVEFYGISIGIYFLQKISRPGITAVASAIVKKINGKPRVIPEEEGDA